MTKSAPTPAIRFTTKRRSESGKHRIISLRVNGGSNEGGGVAEIYLYPAEADAFEAMVNSHAALVEALQLILPLAKGYAAANPVGSNQEYVEFAEATIKSSEGGG